MRDTIHSGIIAGFIGIIGDGLVHKIGNKLLRTTTTIQYISQLIFPGKKVNTIKYGISTAAHWFAGALIGVALSVLLKLSDDDYSYSKGVGVGVLTWLIHVIGIPNLISKRPVVFRKEKEAIVDLIAHITFGLIATTYLVSLSRKGRKSNSLKNMLRI